jgi:DNA-binding LacI/PurR family transcriptional regulator
MANIKDIAKMAGVSVTTVSRVLNHHPYVSEAKKEAVLNAIKQSNYQPNINAIHLSTGKTFLVGVVVPFSNHPYFGYLIEGIAAEALKHNYKLVLFQTNYNEEREREALTMLKLKQIDALIICSRNCSWETIKDYISFGPIVLCEDARNKQVSSTFIDHYKSFNAALDYLYQKGYRNIGYCIGRKTGTNSHQRHQAYLDFLEKVKQPFNEDYIFYDCYQLEDGERVVIQLLNMDHPPSALLVTSDQVAAGILASCKEKQIKIPDELAILGFDNEPIAKVMNITTLEIPLFEVGRKLFNQAMKHDSIFHEEVEVKLIERQTV